MLPGPASDILLQVVMPFILSAAIVVGVTCLAERCGTRIGGIIGTLPHLIVIAFVFIALNRGEEFASEAAVVVPAEIGINILFLLTFAHASHRSLRAALAVSLTIWGILNGILLLTGLHRMWLSVAVFIVCWLFAYLISEKVKRVKSVGRVAVRYTPGKLMGRGVLAGTVIAFAVLMSNLDSAVSGIFSVFPAMFLSTMIISLRDHGPGFTEGLSKAMIFGTPSVMSYAIGVHLLYPEVGILQGTLVSVALSVGVGMTMLGLRTMIR